MTGALGILAERLHGPLTGVGRYIINLIDQWSDTIRRREFPFAGIVLLAREPLPEFGGREGFAVRVRSSRLPDAVWEQWYGPRLARDLAVLFCPSYTAPLLARCPVVVGTLDMLQATRSQDFARTARFVRAPLYRMSARRADDVITLAEATVPQIVEHYGVQPSRVHAIPLAADERFTPTAQPTDDAVAARYGLTGARFVLSVGKLARRRHVPELFAGFARAVDRGRLPHRLVLVGPDPERTAASGSNPAVMHLGHVPDSDLPVLYRRADLVAYLSEDEGFGLPLVEAMRSGTPLLILDRPVLREVAGTNASYLAHATPEAIAGALAMLLTDEALRRTLSLGGLERGGTFDWRATAERTLEVLVRAAARHSLA